MPAMMMETDAAYIAGFLDGEGFICIVRANQTKAKNPSYRLQIGFTNKNLAVLQYIQRFVGGTINPKVSKNPNAAPAFELKTSQREVISHVLHALVPYLIIKREQAHLGLAFLDLGRVKKTMTVVRGKTWPIFRAIPQEIANREEFKQQMTNLNRRGIAS